MTKFPKVILTDKEKAQRAALKRAARPRIASTIVLYTGSRQNPKILMGQRASRSDFMPSVYVFPGGRVDRADNFAPYTGALPARTERILEAACSPRKAKAIVLAAIRETWEETGLMLGRAGSWSKNISHKSWDEFRLQKVVPDLSDINVFGRAITPPHRHKRYDTWFLIAPFRGNPDIVSDSHELLSVGWFDFDHIQKLKTHRATQMMIHVLKDFMARPNPRPDVFFSHMRHGRYQQHRFPA